MGSKKKWLFNIIFLMFTLSLTTYFVMRDEDPLLIIRLLDRANGWYWLAALVMLLIYIYCESRILRLFLNDVGHSPKKGHCFIYSVIGFFFSCITPAAGGGQPAQVYYMHHDGLNPGVTAPILMVVTICFKLVLVIFGVLVLIFRPAELYLADAYTLWWCFAGWVINVCAVLFFVLLILKSKFVERIGLKVLDRLAKRIKKDWVSHWRDKLERTLSRYREITHKIRENPKLFLITLGITFVQRTLMFSITWVVLRSFGITTRSLPTIILMQAMVSLGTDMLPLPGSSGANEALFLLLFEGFCGEALVTPVLLVTRGITYYGQLIICGVLFLLIGSKLGKRKNQ